MTLLLCNKTPGNINAFSQKRNFYDMVNHFTLFAYMLLKQRLSGTDAQLKIHYASVINYKTTRFHAHFIPETERTHKLILIAQSLNHPTYLCES